MKSWKAEINRLGKEFCISKKKVDHIINNYDKPLAQQEKDLSNKIYGFETGILYERARIALMREI